MGAIERDIREAERIGGLGTPTVIVNGWMARGEITVQLLDSLAGPFFAAKETGGR